MEANAYSKYALRDLHQAIDLLDRKMIHCRDLEPFKTQDDRQTALQKLSSKRAALVKSAMALTSLGVRSDPNFLPRSFIHPATPADGSLAPEPAAQSEVLPKRRIRR